MNLHQKHTAFYGKSMFFLILLLSCQLNLLAQNKSGLIVTVGEFLKPENVKDSAIWYPNGIKPLKSPAGDLQLMRKCFLERFEIPANQTVVLTNERATKEAILGALLDGIEKASKGDFFYFYFSGHGSQLRNSSSTEFDKHDETILPYDAVIRGHVIRDKELAQILQFGSQRGVKIIAIMDCCHSGTLSRDVMTEVKSAPAPEMEMQFVQDAPSKTVSEYLVISSSRGDQRSVGRLGSDGIWYSAFTQILYNELNRLKTPLAVDQLVAICNARLMASNQPQRAVVQVPLGRRNQSIEGLEVVWSPDCVVIEEMGTNKWMVSGKAICGWNEGSSLKDPQTGKVFWIEDILSPTEAVVISKSAEKVILKRGKSLVPEKKPSDSKKRYCSVFINDGMAGNPSNNNWKAFKDNLIQTISLSGMLLHETKANAPSDVTLSFIPAFDQGSSVTFDFQVKLKSNTDDLNLVYGVDSLNVDSVVNHLTSVLNKLALHKLFSGPDYTMPKGINLQMLVNKQVATGEELKVKKGDRIELELHHETLSTFEGQFYAYMYGLSSDGSVQLLFPLGGINDENRIHKDSFNQEGNCKLFSFSVGAPYGKDQIVLVLTELPMSNPQLLEQASWNAQYEIRDWLKFEEQPIATRSVEQLGKNRQVFGQRLKYLSVE